MKNKTIQTVHSGATIHLERDTRNAYILTVNSQIVNPIDLYEVAEFLAKCARKIKKEQDKAALEVVPF